ncbi:hypothetical protein M3Y96_00842800 [Aphelenchoides besseyi]|nr:hypothetical protein M3Y96_00842800 [Aphelenchoides besseyi]
MLRRNVLLVVFLLVHLPLVILKPPRHSNRANQHSSQSPVIHETTPNPASHTESDHNFHLSYSTVSSISNNSFPSFESNRRFDESQISTCFGKIRTSLTLNPDFRGQFDSVVRSSRIDQLDNLVRRRITNMCTQQERVATERFLSSYKPAVEIANELLRQLTNDERDRLNVWNNLNDTESERKFYRAKFNDLPREQYSVVYKAYNEIVGKLFNSSMNSCLQDVLLKMKDRDFKQLQTFAREDEYDSIRSYVNEKIKDSGRSLSATDRSELENFFVNAFGKVTIVAGTGSRQYELKHTNNDDE